MPRPKKPRGRPVEKPMPERIADTPENVARIVMNTPAKKREDWKYIKARRGKGDD